MIHKLSFSLLILTSAVSVAAAQSVDRVSISSAGLEADNLSSRPSISADGTLIGYYSDATNLVPGDLNGAMDVFLRDTVAGTTEVVSVSSLGVLSNGTSSRPAISGDGRFVTFYSDGTNLVPGDTNAIRDVFVRDRLLGTTALVSRAATGVLSNGDSSRPSISDDGRLVAFRSYASNLVPGDLNQFGDVFLVDRDADQDGIFDELGATTTTLVSRTSTGAGGNGLSSVPRISADGTSVVFRSEASNLVVGDTNGRRDIFSYSVASGVVTLLSATPAGVVGNGDSTRPSISDDGRFVAYFSDSTNLVVPDTNQSCALDLFGQLVCVPASDCFVVDRDTDGNGVFDEPGLVSVSKISMGIGGVEANDRSEDPEISGDGRYVAFWTSATNVFAGDTNGVLDAVLHDRDAEGNGIFDEVGGTTTVALNRSDAGVLGNGISKRAVVSDHGEVSAFRSDATNLIVGDTNGFYDVYRSFTPAACSVTNYGTSSPSCLGAIAIGLTGCATAGNLATFSCTNAPPSSVGLLAIGLSSIPTGIPLLGINVYLNPAGPLFLFGGASDATGQGAGSVPIPPGTAGVGFFAQFIWFNTPACGGAGTYSASDGLTTTIVL